MSSIFPLDPQTAVGQVRLLTADTVERIDPANPTNPAEYYFPDTSIQGFLSLNGQNIKLAAANVLMAFATNESLISKKIRTEDLQTDGPAVTNALRLLAQDYRTQGNHDRDLLAADASFEIVDYADPVTPYDTFEYGVGGLLWH